MPALSLINLKLRLLTHASVGRIPIDIHHNKGALNSLTTLCLDLHEGLGSTVLSHVHGRWKAERLAIIHFRGKDRAFEERHQFAHVRLQELRVEFTGPPIRYIHPLPYPNAHKIWIPSTHLGCMLHRQHAGLRELTLSGRIPKEHPLPFFLPRCLPKYCKQIEAHGSPSRDNATIVETTVPELDDKGRNLNHGFYIEVGGFKHPRVWLFYLALFLVIFRST